MKKIILNIVILIFYQNHGCREGMFFILWRLSCHNSIQLFFLLRVYNSLACIKFLMMITNSCFQIKGYLRLNFFTLCIFFNNHSILSNYIFFGHLILAVDGIVDLDMLFSSLSLTFSLLAHQPYFE